MRGIRASKKEKSNTPLTLQNSNTPETVEATPTSTPDNTLDALDKLDVDVNFAFDFETGTDFEGATTSVDITTFLFEPTAEHVPRQIGNRKNMGEN